MRGDFAIFICTHERPNKQLTLNTLRNCGYTGKIYLVLDDTDSSIQQYIDIYGASNVFIFNKQRYINLTDTVVAHDVAPVKCVVYGRNAVEDIAHSLQLSCYAVADDDTKEFRHRWISDGALKSTIISKNMDDVINEYVSFLLNTNVSYCSFGCVPNYFGGASTYDAQRSNARTCHNFIFKTCDFHQYWMASYVEDMTTPFVYGRIGQIWLSILDVEMINPICGTTVGGMQTTYLSIPEFKRQTYALVCSPSSTTVRFIKNKWRICVAKDLSLPKIISQKYRKGEDISSL